MTITIVLPIPPTTNKLWAPVRTKRGAKMVARDTYADWKAMAKREVEAQREGAALDGAFRAAILVPEGAYDADNLIKPTLDACQAGERALCARLAAVTPRDMQVMAKLTAILTRCDDLEAMAATDGRLDPNQVRIDAARIRQMAEEARALLVAVSP